MAFEYEENCTEREHRPGKTYKASNPHKHPRNQSYLTSNIRLNILKTFSDYTPEKVLTKNEYYKYRAVMVGEIIFRSAQRAGIVCGIRRSEVSAAEMVQESLNITVFNYKTGKLKPAVVFLEKLSSKAILNSKTTF